MRQPYKFIAYFIVTVSVLIELIWVSVKLPEWHGQYIVNTVGEHVVQISPPRSSASGGTGFVVYAPSGSRYTLTNAHICQIAENGVVHAISNNLNRYTNLMVIEISKEYDLCLLSAPFGSGALSLASNLEIGQSVGVLGHPLLEYSTLSKGYVTNFQTISLVIGTNWEKERCDFMEGAYEDISQSPIASFLGIMSVCKKSYEAARTTATIFPGNSGSPTVNVYGNVVGVAFAANTRDNLGLIVPLKNVKNFLEGY